MLHHCPISTPERNCDYGCLSCCTAAAQVFPFPCLNRVFGIASALALAMRNRHFLISHASVDVTILQSGTYWPTLHFHTCVTAGIANFCNSASFSQTSSGIKWRTASDSPFPDKFPFLIYFTGVTIAAILK